MTPDQWQLEVLARTVYGEARSEPVEGRVAVAWVFVNRGGDAAMRWPVTVAGACLQRAQASCWNETDRNRARIMALPSADAQLTACREVARAVLAGEVDDITLGANHYLTADLAERNPPSWHEPEAVTVRIGRHEFLRL